MRNHNNVQECPEKRRRSSKETNIMNVLFAKNAETKKKKEIDIPNERNSHEAPSAFHPAARGISHDFRFAIFGASIYLSIYLYII